MSFNRFAFNVMNKNENGSEVAKLYNCNNDFLSVRALSSSISASKSPPFLNLNT